MKVRLKVENNALAEAIREEIATAVKYGEINLGENDSIVLVDADNAEWELVVRDLEVPETTGVVPPAPEVASDDESDSSVLNDLENDKFDLDELFNALFEGFETRDFTPETETTETETLPVQSTALVTLPVQEEVDLSASVTFNVDEDEDDVVPFFILYKHNGKFYSVPLYANSLQEAQEHFNSVLENGDVYGKN